jgi:nitroreductase
MNVDTAVSFDDVMDVAAAVERAIFLRHSCRGFLADPVPHALIESMITTAQRSASWCNSQAWQLHVTEGGGTERFRDALSKYASEQMGGGNVPKIASDIPMPERYVGTYRDRRKQCGLALYQRLGIGPEDRAGSARAMLRNFSLFGAPHVMIVTTPRDLGTYGAVDCGSFVSTFLTIAAAHGVATIAQGAIAVYSSFIREYFAIPEGRMILCGVSFGFEDMSDPANGFRTERALVNEVVDWVTA